MRKLKLFSLFLCLFIGVGQVWGADVADKLTASDLAATGTTYTDFSNVSKTSDAVYAGNSAKDGSGNIQLRSKNSNSGVVSTTSGGTVKSVKITVGSGSNSIDIYGSNTAYTAASNLYASGTQGTKVGTLTATGTITFTDDYAYVGIRSNSGALYLSEIEITWTTAGGGGSNKPTLSGIQVETPPTKVNYLVGENFDPTGLVITRSYEGDTNDDTYAYAGHTSEFSFAPTTSTALTKENTSVTITYAEKETSQDINVYGATLQAQDEDGNDIPSGGPGAPTRNGASITPAADANNYVFKEWQIDGATLGSTATTKNNTITSPTKDVTVTAVYYKPITVTYKANGSDFTTQTYGYGATLAFPESNPEGATYSCSGKTFVGWVAETNKNYSHASTAPTYATAGGAVDAAATYYAVFAKSEGSSKTYNLTINTDNFNNTSYAANNNEKTTQAVNVSDENDKIDVKWTSNQIYQNSGMQWKKSEGYIYNSTDLGTINSVTVNSSEGEFTTYYGTSAQPSSGAQGSGKGYFKTSVGSAIGKTTSVVINFTKSSSSNSNYSTTCCTELETINGFVTKTHNSVTITWDNVTGSSNWAVKLNNASVGTISSINEGAQKKCVISNLESTTEYTFVVSADVTGYCSNKYEENFVVTTDAALQITAQTNNESYGTVSLSGLVITGAPKPYCQYASTAYTVVSGTATVSQNGNAFTVTPTTDCTIKINFQPIPVTSVTLSDDALALETGGNATLTATVEPQGVANPAVTWVSSDETVATVADGVVTAVAEGTATITCKSVVDAEIKDECAVTVTDPLPVSSLIFTEACGGSGTADDGAVWAVTSDGTESNFADDGIHYGTNSASVTYLQLATSDINGTVKTVVVRARDAQADATISVTVGGTEFTCSGSASATNTSANYTFTGSASGEVVVRVERTSKQTKAIYVKSVVVTYERVYSAVTVATGLANGSVTVDGATDLTKVAAGTELTLSNTPASGYQLVDYDVYKTGDSDTKVTVTNGKFIMPTYPVTVSASFEEEKNLESIAITNPASKLTFWVNETFSAEGVAIKAVYDNTTEKANVTPKSITAPNMSEAGQKTVTIAYEEKGIEKTTSYEIIVKALPTTAEKAATVAEIREIYDLFEDTEGLYVKGTIYKISGFYSNKYITYWITDSYDAEAETEADNHTNEFRLYNCLDFSGASFTAQTDLELGQEVVVNGNLTLVNEIYQFSAGGVIISRPKYVKSIALSGEYTTEFNENAEFSHEGMVVTATYNYGDDAEVSEDAATTWSEPDMTTAGEKTVTVSYTFDGKTVTKDYTITVNHVCASEITITKDEEANGTFALSATGAVCGDGDGAEVEVTDIAPAEGYRFKTITATVGDVDNDLKKVTGIKANATISVEFEQIPTHQVTWNVNGDETTKTIVQEGSKPVFPATPVSCDDAVDGSKTFIGWATEPWTGKAENLNEKTVYTSAADMDPVTAEGTKYYAVFAKATAGDPVPMTLWSEDFSSYKADDVPEGGSPISYSVTNGGGTTKVYTTQLGAGGDSPELLVAKSNGTFTASGIATNGVSSATLTYHTNQTSNLTVKTTAEHVTIGSVSVDGTDTKLCTRTITFAEGAPETFDLTFTMTTGSNSRLDDIVLSAELSSVSYSEFLTTCCTKYDIALADGGTVVVEEVQQGTFSAEFEKACADTEVKLTASPATKYHFDAWSVSYNDGENDQTVTVNETEVENVKVYSFTMPAFDVTVSATFVHDDCANLVAPTQNGTIEPTYNSATIAWNAVANASSYYVTVTENEETEPIFSANVNNITSKELEGLKASTTYNFSVMAVGDGTDFCAEGNDSLKGSFITIAAPVYTVHFSTGANNPTQADIAEDVRGEGITIPAGPTPVCEGWAFAGWATAAVAPQTTEAPATLYKKDDTYIPNEDNKTLYAVYSTEVASSGNGGSVEITTDTENFPTGYGNANTFTEYTLDGYKFKIQQAYINGGKLQWRASGSNNGTGTIYNTQVYPQKITSVVLVYNSSDGNKNFTLNVGDTENPTSGTAITPEIDGSTYTFNCSAANADYFVLTNGTNAGYLDTITINYGVASVTNYISEPACCTKYDITIATGIENGSVTADLAKACEGVEVTLTPIASASYHLESLSVMNGETPVDVDANNKFNMPAGNVTVSATFVHDDCTNLDAPTLNEVTKDHHSATIAWNAVEGAVSYVLNVTEHNAAAIVTNESVTETSKALSSLKPSTQYDYSIMAVGDGTDKCADGNALLEGNFTTDEPATTGTFELFTGNLTEGDYVITHASANAIKAEINSDRFAALEVSPSEDIITNPDESIIWHIAQSGEYWTIYNVAAEKYAASTGAKNKGALSTDGTDDKALWSLSGTYDFINKQNTANNVNATLRYNSQNALNTSWACYASGTGSTLVLYKKVDASKPSTPTFTVAGGEYESAQTVHIACATEGATIHYTTDGTTPTSESAEFTEDLVISTNTTLQAIAIKGDVSSNVATATYTFIVWKSVDEIWNDITADGPTDARVYGYVSDTTISGYKNNFYISVDGSKEGNQLYAYRMNMNDKTITIGDKVKLRGDLTIYNNVKEFKYTSNTNCGQVISVEPKGDLQSIVVSEAPTKTVYAANEDFEPAGLVVTGTYENGYVGVITEGITWGNDLTENKVTESTTVHVTATVGEVTSPAYEVAVTVATKTLVSIAATPVTYTIYTGEALPQPTIMATYSEGDPEDVSAFATYDSENVFNTETIDNPDPQTITVSYTFGEETQTTTYTVSVKDYANDAENPYTVAEALYIITNAIGNTNSARDIYVQGIVCQKSNPSSKTQTYYISDDGTTTTKLEIYKGKYLAGADFTEDNQVLVNDEVLVGGKVIYYNSNTPEFASGLSQLYSLSRTPNFSIANVTAFEVGAEDKAAVVTKDGNGAVTLASSSDVEVVTIVDNKLHAVAPGMATITANLAASGIYKASQTEFSVEVVAAQAHHILTLKTSGVVYRAIDAFEGTSVWNLLDTVTAPNIAGYNFKGWSLTEAEEVLTEGTAGTLDADMTLYAVYAKGNVTYVKVTETSAITSGQYLIVYEGDNSHDAVAFNGALETLDAASNIINVAIVNEVITGTNSTAAAEFTIDATANTIRSKSGKYIGRTTSGNGMNTSEEATLTNTMSIDADQNFVVKGTGGNIFLMYNSNSGDKRFRYYGGTQKAIQLYKRTDGAESAPVSNPTITVEENEVVNVSDVAAEGVPVSIVVENGGTMNIDQTTIATNITAKDGATINVNEETTAENIVVENGGKIVTNAPTTTPTVYFATTMGAADNNGDFHGIASELGGVTNITLAQGGEIIYDLTLGTSKAGVQADPSHWHAFSLPFEVDALNGIYDAETGLKLTNEVNYAIMDYHGDIRANGDYGWKKYRGTLKPGVFYLMTVDGNTTTFRFKATQAGQMDQTNSMSAKAYDGTGADTDKGWNGFGNPRWIEGAFGHDAQYLDPYTYEYITIIPGMTIPVGLPFFYKASTTSPVQMDEVGTTYAPARSKAYEIKNVAVRFGNEESKDKLYISASEDALNEYEQDKDLVKMFMSQTPNVARISGKAYGMKLAKVYAPMVNDQAEYSLTLYAPQAGEYTISVSEVENADIYLTHEGTIIWNLSMGAYTNDFAKGNTEGYGLLLVKKAPSVATGVDSAEANEAGVQKVIIEDKVFILRGGQMYDVTGKAVR